MGNWNRDVVGDGEGGDLKVFGTTIYSQLIYVVTFKVRKYTVVSPDLPQPTFHLLTSYFIAILTQALMETKSLIWGEWYTFTCRRGKGEGWWNRIGYTWVGITWFSLIFYIWFLYMYEVSIVTFVVIWHHLTFH